MPAGRPSDYTPEKAEAICTEIAEGKSLRAICKRDDMPSMPAVLRWLSANPEFRIQYARAREAQADAIFDECLYIADTFDAEEITDPQHINRAKLRIDTRKWMAGKLRPKKYGDKLAIGGDDEMDPIKTEEVGSGAAKVLAVLDQIAERSGKTGEPDAE